VSCVCLSVSFCFSIWLLNVKKISKCYGKSNVNKTNENSTLGCINLYSTQVVFY
jgi:hypothetical protein